MNYSYFRNPFAFIFFVLWGRWFHFFFSSQLPRDKSLFFQELIGNACPFVQAVRISIICFQVLGITTAADRQEVYTKQNLGDFLYFGISILQCAIIGLKGSLLVIRSMLFFYLFIHKKQGPSFILVSSIVIQSGYSANSFCI